MSDQDWLDLARLVNWSGTAMAKHCGVSVRTLHRHFFKRIGKNPKSWLAEQRLSHAVGLLNDGCSIKETAAGVAYKQQSSLTRKYKSHFGVPPTLQRSVDNTAQAKTVRK
ncbi:MAG TPA: helix-turn-helix transcriptional regulator [Verrucomicrobiae bacterium]|jgi:AraC family transcriptional activator FtrA|nr:helix-turn-helix transcriptional regulator [Verrucomicrobiae bacterium]